MALNTNAHMYACWHTYIFICMSRTFSYIHLVCSHTYVSYVLIHMSHMFSYICLVCSHMYVSYILICMPHAFSYVCLLCSHMYVCCWDHMHAVCCIRTHQKPKNSGWHIDVSFSGSLWSMTHLSPPSLGQCYDCHQWWCLQFEWSGQSASPHRHLDAWAPSEFECVLPCHHTPHCSETVDTLLPSSRWRWWALSKTTGSQRRDCHAKLTFYFSIDDLGTLTTCCQSYCDPGGCSSVCCMLCMGWSWPEAYALLGTWWCPLW